MCSMSSPVQSPGGKGHVTNNQSKSVLGKRDRDMKRQQIEMNRDEPFRKAWLSHCPCKPVPAWWCVHAVFRCDMSHARNKKFPKACQKALEKQKKSQPLESSPLQCLSLSAFFNQLPDSGQKCCTVTVKVFIHAMPAHMPSSG